MPPANQIPTYRLNCLRLRIYPATESWSTNPPKIQPNTMPIMPSVSSSTPHPPCRSCFPHKSTPAAFARLRAIANFREQLSPQRAKVGQAISPVASHALPQNPPQTTQSTSLPHPQLRSATIRKPMLPPQLYRRLPARTPRQALSARPPVSTSKILAFGTKPTRSGITDVDQIRYPA
jgi:hypothetical protein